MNPDFCSFSNQSLLLISADTRFRDLAVIFGCCFLSIDVIAVSRREAFTCKTSGKSTSKTLLSFKQLRRHLCGMYGKHGKTAYKDWLFCRTRHNFIQARTNLHQGAQPAILLEKKQ